MAENFVLDALRPQPTGGVIVTFHDDVDFNQQERALADSTGGAVRSFSATADTGAFEAAMTEDTAAVVYEDLGIAVIPETTAEAQAAVQALSVEDSVAEVRPEFWLFELQTFSDSSDRTWGIAATGAENSQLDGEGIKLCVLDTGLDLHHQDFTGRPVVSRSLVPGESVQDGQGHGTHCAGTAAGRTQMASIPRYGVAPRAYLHVGKVLNNQGSGRERDIIAGMLWAIETGCEVISMSLGRAVRPGESPSLAYERVGRQALDKGSLIVAAAGNDSSRGFGFIAPVGAPANSPSIMAVAALAQDLSVADFSNGGINSGGGEVDIAGPGVGVFSSVPRPRNYRVLAGTSMACPHVAGCAALWAQSDTTLRGRQLWDQLVAKARATGAPARDVGAGLVQAP